MNRTGLIKFVITQIPAKTDKKPFHCPGASGLSPVRRAKVYHARGTVTQYVAAETQVKESIVATLSTDDTLSIMLVGEILLATTLTTLAGELTVLVGAGSSATAPVITGEVISVLVLLQDGFTIGVKACL